MVVRMERVDATGGASPLPYEKWVGSCGFGRVNVSAVALIRSRKY